MTSLHSPSAPRPRASRPPAAPLPAAPLPAARPSAAHGGRRRGLQLLLGVVVFLAAEMTVVTVGGLTASPWMLLLGACAGAAVALGGYLLIVGLIGGRPGLGLRGRGKLAELAAGLVLGTALLTLAVGLIALLGGYRVTGISASPQLLAPLAVGIGAGVIEEIVFRGILLRVLESWWGSWVALAITSLLFGLIHLMNPGASILTALLLVVEAGVLLGAAYLLTRRLWFAFGLHIAWNTVQAGMFSSAVSGTGTQRGLLVAEMHGPTWLTGGSMGIEGSLLTVLLGFVTGIVMLLLAARRGHLQGPARKRR
ncbi:lysostaphin resistance A-like protein [Brachybacterium sp. AOP42-B2-9]|uniref:lysostaphin resistance A-like protein n=1 Tax=Brachybacterium sp. AOP42-B2-9 TaxID=3457672 RepID=UPI0040336D1C